MERKGRCCGLEAKKGSLYCGAHNEPGRIPCPVDPSHTVNLSQLAKHVKICNATKDALFLQTQAYFKQDINVDVASDDDDDEPVNVKEVDVEVEKGSDSPEEEDGTRVDRHLRQGEKIAALIEEAALIVDLGGGKGSLAACCRERYPSAALCVVDREARRFKYDRCLRREDFERIRCDLRSFNLRGLPGRDIAGVAKHLCGAATDLALRALVRDPRTRHIAIATCCHHRCDWDLYVGRPYFRERRWGRRSVFDDLKQKSSWFSIPKDDDDKRSLGKQCKRVIDAGRLAFLRDHGFSNSRLVTYCDPVLSPENVLILASRDP